MYVGVACVMRDEEGGGGGRDPVQQNVQFGENKHMAKPRNPQYHYFINRKLDGNKSRF